MCACGNKSNAASAEVTKIQDNQMTTQPDSNSVVVDITTSLGDIKVLLYGDTPKHRDNFVKLVNEGFYNGVLFHRVINEFMIQAGDPESKNAPAGKMLGSGDPGDSVMAMRRNRDQAGLQKLQEELVAITEQKAAENPAKMTPEQRQAYSTIGGTPHLDGSYTVFGEVIEGMDVVDKIQNVETGAADRPVEDVKIIKMSIEK